MYKTKIPEIPKIIIAIFFELENIRSFDDHKKVQNAIGRSAVKDLENGFRNEVCSRSMDRYPTEIP
jgi:hypothetical protein